MTAPEDQRAGAVKALEERQRAVGPGAGSQEQERQAQQQDEEEGPGHDARSAADGDADMRAQFGVCRRQEPPAEETGEQDHQDLPRRGGRRKDDDDGQDGDRHAQAVGAELARHAPDGLGHDRHGDDLEAVNPGGVSEIKTLDAVREQHERDSRRQREAQPGGQPSQRPRPQDPDGGPDLAAGGPGKELEQGDEVRVRVLVEPAPPQDILLPEITQVGDRPAKAADPKAEGRAEDFEE